MKLALTALEPEGVRWSADPIDRAAYAADASTLSLLWARHSTIPDAPEAVAWPRDEAAVQALVRTAREHRLTLIPFGAGTGTSGGTWARAGGITVDLKRLKHLGPIDSVQRSVQVGAGLSVEVLERQLNASGWTLGAHAATSEGATVGALVATGALGPALLSFRAVTGAGELLDSALVSSVGALVTGSEGTFCIFTQVRLRVRRLAPSQQFCAFEFSSLETGLNGLQAMLTSGLRPTWMELSDPLDSLLNDRRDARVDAVGRHHFALSKLREALTKETLGRPGALRAVQKTLRKTTLSMLWEGTRARTDSSERIASRLCLELGARDLSATFAQERFRGRQRDAFEVSTLMRSGAFVDALEFTAPWARVAAVLDRASAAVTEFAVVSARVSPGGSRAQLRLRVFGSGNDAAQLQDRYECTIRRLIPAVLSAGGTLGTAGIGLLKAREYQESLGDRRLVAHSLKRLFDPDGVLNPGKLGL